MAPHDHKQLIRKLFDESMKGNFDFIDDVYAENCSFHDPAFPAGSVAEMKEQGRQMSAAIPDMHVNIHEILADGDMTAARWTMGGTHQGEFQGMPPTGKSFVLTGIVMDKWEGDRIVEEWNSYDVASLSQQLGFMPGKAETVETASSRTVR